MAPSIEEGRKWAASLGTEELKAQLDQSCQAYMGTRAFDEGIQAWYEVIVLGAELDRRFG